MAVVRTVANNGDACPYVIGADLCLSILKQLDETREGNAYGVLVADGKASLS